MTSFSPIEARSNAFRTDLFVALALAVILTIGWSITDWPRLGQMLLPDTDDMMRLAQVRDWLAGQATNDWTQYRMAPPAGAPMHWSRVNDAGIAAIILAVKPLAGNAHAELIAVLVYPALLFVAALFLSARIARRLWGAAAGPVAAILTALAFPGTMVFLPGRIDHHALQVVLIQSLALLLMRAASVRTGLAAGAIMALTLAVGLETVPHVAALLIVLFFGWVAGGAGERERLGGFAAGLAAVTLFFFAFLRPTFWSAQLCDAFTPASVTGALAGAAALAALAAAQPWLRDWRWRLCAGVLAGGAALGLTLIAYPSCVSGPYGKMDPFLLTAFMPFVGEATSLFAQPRVTDMIAFGGVLAMASAVAVWMVAKTGQRWRVTLPIAAVIWISAIITLAQVRGSYIGAPLGAPVLAGLVLAARHQTWRTAAVIGAWLAGAGMAYLEIPKRVESLFAPAAAPVEQPILQLACGVGDGWAQIDRQPPGVIMAGTSIAAYVIGATHHATVGAGYHRNNAGNMAMYRFFLGDPAQSRAVARQWRVDYVLFCPGDFDEIDVGRVFPHSLAAQLRAGRPPSWLEPVPLHGTPMRLFRMH